MKSVEAAKRVNGCEGEATAWEERGTLHPSPKGAPVVAWIHDEGHKYPAGSAALIAKFFRERARAE